MTLSKVILSLSSLLMDPNPDDPLRSDAAKLYKEDLEAYNLKVREIIDEFATDDGIGKK